MSASPLTGALAAGPPAATRRRRFRLRAVSPQGLAPYLFIAPNVVLFTTFSFLPLFYAVFISFHDWGLLGDPEWTGLQNYVRLVHDPLFWRALLNTVLYALATVPTSMALGLLLAIGLNRRFPGRVLVRSVYFLPVVVSAVGAGTLAAWLFNDNYGGVNALLVHLGIGRIAWLSRPQWALPSLAIATLWVRIGFNMVVYLAALQSIPRTYFEAAWIDGASAVSQFWHITLPMLAPATFLLLILDIIYSFQVFDLVYVMTGGGPGFSTTMMVQYIFNAAFTTSEMGYASAMGVALYMLILVFTVVQWRASRQSEAAL